MLACLLFTSCLFYQRYPTRWSPKEQHSDKDCWEILGTYSDKGETGHKKPDSTSLSSLIFRSHPLDVREATSVKIAKLDDDSLEISVWNGEKQLHAQSFSQSKKEFRCSSKGIKISMGTGGGGTSGELEINWSHLNLAINTERSLIVESVLFEFGFFPIPGPWGSSYWSVFKRIDAPGH
jgi:hypothetical protein